MATEEHKQLAQYIKGVHASLRKLSSKLGVQKAWYEHCNNVNVLTTYAKCMEQLATTHWESNGNKTNEMSRIQWSADFCYSYYFDNYYVKFHNKEKEISSKINVQIDLMEEFSLPLKLLDVGSCYNPFKKYDFLDVLPIDLCPANESVYQCDFLEVVVGEIIVLEDKKVNQLQQDSYDVVTFCFLLEYIPNSELRIQACNKAYNLLKPGGLLIINTPDSKHVGANSKLMKSWRYTLAHIGFSRIKYEKFKHMHCIAFRKSLHKSIGARWTTLYKEPYMDFSMNIPQDFLNEDEDVYNYSKIISHDSSETAEYFEELPFKIDFED